MTYQSASRARPRGNDIRPGDRVLFRGRGIDKQYGLVKETRAVPSPFGGRAALWARVVWESTLREPGWMCVGAALEVVPAKFGSQRY